MKNKLFYKIYLNLVVVFLFFYIFLIIYLVNIYRKDTYNNIEKILTDDLVIINEIIKDYIKEKKYKDADKIIKNISSYTKKRISIINSKGEVIVDSEEDVSLLENQLNKPEIQIAFKKGQGKFILQDPKKKKEVIHFAKKFDIKEKSDFYIIKKVFYVNDINENLKKVTRNLIFLLIIIVLVLIIIGYFYSKKLYEPIIKIKNATEEIAKGNFSSKIIIKEKNEFKDLAENFNLMTSKLKTYFEEISEKQDHINSLISVINDGVIAIKKSGEIIFVNDGFKKVFGENIRENKFFWEFLMPMDIIKIIDDTMKQKQNLLLEAELKNKVFLIKTSYIEKYEQIVLTIHDITSIKEIQKIKKDIVANVSHELKTPLTAISGFTETALNITKDKEIKHYLEIIYSNTQRLINIINDLLILSDIERKDRKLNIEEINLKKMINDIEKLFEKKIKDKNLQFKIEIDKNATFLNADKFMLEQIFINLIDNAIKYTDRGEIKLNIYRRDDKNVIIDITDTGIGIPEEHISRIFERFYVVDKSRSKESGGTGLGLSIVKNIVNLHNGEIIVNSKVGEGTKFLIILPEKK